MMTTVVPTSEEDPALSVVRFTAKISWADAGPEVAEAQVSRLCLEAQECMITGRWLDLASLMLTSADLIFSKASEKDLECVFTVICNLVKNSDSLDEALEMAKLISTKITQQPHDKPALRLKIMFNLYNLLENPYSRFFVYMKALDLAVHGKVIELIIPSFKKLDDFLKEWNLGVQDQRQLFLSASNILKECKSSAKDSFKFLTKYLATFSGEDAHSMGETEEAAVRSIIEFLKTPDMFQLLKIFLTQKLDAYLEFHSTNSSWLKSYGLVHEECIAKMRLMLLVDLGANEYGHIPYDLIMDTLQIS